MGKTPLRIKPERVITQTKKAMEFVKKRRAALCVVHRRATTANQPRRVPTNQAGQPEKKDQERQTKQEDCEATKIDNQEKSNQRQTKEEDSSPVKPLNQRRRANNDKLKRNSAGK